MAPQPESETPPTRLQRLRRYTGPIVAGVVVVVVVLGLVPLVSYFGADLALGVLALLGVAAAVGALGSADAAKGQTIGGALVTIGLLAFAAFALVVPAVLK